jgi:hypothetical protein
VPAAAAPKAVAEPRVVVLRAAAEPRAVALRVAVPPAAANPAVAARQAAHLMQVAARLAVVRAAFPLPVVPAVGVAAQDLRAAATRVAVAAA